MGEAKRRTGAVAPTNDRLREILRAKFDGLSIDYSKPGFYDDPNFIAHERGSDRLFVESYAQWVITRERTPEYDSRVRDVLPKLANIIKARIVRHNWNGGCIAICQMLTRMLDKLGIWNVPFSGSASIYVGNDSRHISIVNDREGEGFSTGHMWLQVPPYEIVDLTIHFQRWREDGFQLHIPEIILAETSDVVPARVKDVVAPEVLGRCPSGYFSLRGDQKRVLSLFPARRILMGDADIRYVPAGFVVPDGPLESVNTEARSGVPAIEIWRDDVVPTFGLP